MKAFMNRELLIQFLGYFNNLCRVNSEIITIQKLLLSFDLWDYVRITITRPHILIFNTFVH